jgi:hypothetical protein
LSGAAEYLENLDAMCGLHDEDDGVHFWSDNTTSNGVYGGSEKKLEMKKEALKLEVVIYQLPSNAYTRLHLEFLHHRTTTLSHSATANTEYITNLTSIGGAVGIEDGSYHQVNNLDMLTYLLKVIFRFV